MIGYIAQSRKGEGDEQPIFYAVIQESNSGRVRVDGHHPD